MFSSELKIFRYGTHGHTCRTNSVRVFVASPHDTLLFKLSAILAVCIELDAAQLNLCVLRAIKSNLFLMRMNK